MLGVRNAVLGLALCLAVPLCERASAQILAPTVGRELIGPVTVVPSQSIELVFPNVFDLFHPKRLVWEGFTGTMGDPAQGGVSLKFDWIDPLTGGGVYSPDFPLPPNAGTAIEYIIPFCPQQVSIHFETENPAGYVVQGVFVHECVPEPSQFALVAGLGMLTFGAIRRCRQVKASA